MSVSFSVQGYVIEVQPLEYVGPQKRPKQNVVLKCSQLRDGRVFSEFYPIEFFGEALSHKSQQLQPGMLLEVACNLGGKEYTSKQTGRKGYFIAIKAWKIESAYHPNGQYVQFNQVTNPPEPPPFDDHGAPQIRGFTLPNSNPPGFPPPGQTGDDIPW